MARTSDYGENKKRRNFRITDAGYNGLQQFAKTLGISTSELLERLGRKCVSETEYRKFLKSIDK